MFRLKIIKISDSEEIHVQESVFRKGRIDIRRFVRTKRYTGYTKQGFTLPKEKVKELLSAIEGEVNEKTS